MYRVISKREQIKDVYSKLDSADVIALDTEATSLNVFEAKVLLIQIEANGSIFILDCLKLDKDLIEYILDLIIDSNKIVIGHNIKYDIKVIKTNFNKMIVNAYDTMNTEVLINQGIGKQYYSYVDLVEKYCSVELDKEVRVTFEKHTGEFTEQQLIYSALDVKYLGSIRSFQLKKIKDQGLNRTLELENELLAAVCSMELNGVNIDREVWSGLMEDAKIRANQYKALVFEHLESVLNTTKFNDALTAYHAFSLPKADLTKKLKEELGTIKDVRYIKGFITERFNIDSSFQMKALFKLCKIPVESTGSKVLASYRKPDNIVDNLLNYREWNKKVTTYGEGVINEINPITDKFHPEFHQLGTVTGRFSASRVHQMPREKEYRYAFVASPGYKIVTIDYSQQEFRLAGEISKEPKIIEAYNKGLDMHTATASILFDKPVEEIIKSERDDGKTVNFALLYGSTYYGLAYNLKISVEKAKELLEKVISGYTKLGVFKNTFEEKVFEKKYSSTLLGRKRYFENRTLFRDSYDRYKYETNIKREGFNLLIQGTGADMIKIAMRDVFYKNPFGEALRLYLQVHDEIVSEVREDVLKEGVEFLESCMLNAEKIFLKEIPSKVDTNILDHWTKG